jgi:hypothetical protein
MQNISAPNLGLTVYDNFKASSTFSVAIVADVDEIQYWRDRPLYLGEKKPILADAITYGTGLSKDYIENEEVQEYLEGFENIQKSTDDYLEQIKIISEKINEFTFINEGEDLDVFYPQQPGEFKKFYIKDEDGFIVRKKTVDLNERPTKHTNGQDIPITILDGFPENWSDDDNPTEPHEASITTLPDSYLKEKLWISTDYLPTFNNEMAKSSNILTSALKKFNYLEPDLPDMDPVNDYVSNLETPIPMWYGIPLINISPEGTSIKDSYILQINTRKGWSLDITNVIGVGIENFELNIDKSIQPGKRFIAGLNVNPNQLTIFLKVEGDPELYIDSIRLKEPLNVKLTSFGADNEGKKTLCGHIWDMFHWEVPQTFNDSPTTPLPDFPNGPTDTDGNTVSTY